METVFDIVKANEVEIEMKLKKTGSNKLTSCTIQEIH